MNTQTVGFGILVASMAGVAAAPEPCWVDNTPYPMQYACAANPPTPPAGACTQYAPVAIQNDIFSGVKSNTTGKADIITQYAACVFEYKMSRLVPDSDPRRYSCNGALGTEYVVTYVAGAIPGGLACGFKAPVVPSRQGG